MRDAEWGQLLEQVRDDARLRLAAVMKRFCDHGERDLPGGAFRWLARSDPPREGAFEALGTVLRGHATDRVFFVTSVEIDPDTAPPRRRGRRSDAAQPQLPLTLLTDTETRNGRDR
jgi:hypothetical protein